MCYQGEFRSHTPGCRDSKSFCRCHDRPIQATLLGLSIGSFDLAAMDDRSSSVVPPIDSGHKIFFVYDEVVHLAMDCPHHIFWPSHKLIVRGRGFTRCVKGRGSGIDDGGCRLLS